MLTISALKLSVCIASESNGNQWFCVQTLDLMSKNEKHLDMIKEQRNIEVESNCFRK
jgi:hypothetical protein